MGPSGGVPEYDADGKETGRLVITLDWIEDVFLYTQAVRDWIESADGCLKVRQ